MPLSVCACLGGCACVWHAYTHGAKAARNNHCSPASSGQSSGVVWRHSRAVAERQRSGLGLGQVSILVGGSTSPEKRDGEAGVARFLSTECPMLSFSPFPSFSLHTLSLSSSRLQSFGWPPRFLPAYLPPTSPMFKN